MKGHGLQQMPGIASQRREDIESGVTMKSKGPFGTRKRRNRRCTLPLNVLLGTLGVFIFFLVLGSMKKSRESGLGGGRAKVDTGQPTLFTYRIVEEYDHDPNAFTQGFEILKKCDRSGKECTTSFIESTGLNRKSTVREVDIETGEVVRSKQLAAEDFGEGVTRLGNRLYQLTWRSPKIFEYDVDNFDNQKMRKTSLKDGWGITNDGTSLIIGDSSHVLYFVNPSTMKTERSIPVTDDGASVTWINELEWVDGLIYANIWQRECIAQIEPTTGNVVGWVDLSGITNKLMADMRAAGNGGYHIDVLNGIAWDDGDGKLYITGKLWPKVYQIELRPMYVDSKSIDVKKMTAQVRERCILPPGTTL